MLESAAGGGLRAAAGKVGGTALHWWEFCEITPTPYLSPILMNPLLPNVIFPSHTSFALKTRYIEMARQFGFLLWLTSTLPFLLSVCRIICQVGSWKVNLSKIFINPSSVSRITPDRIIVRDLHKTGISWP